MNFLDFRALLPLERRMGQRGHSLKSQYCIRSSDFPSVNLSVLSAVELYYFQIGIAFSKMKKTLIVSKM
jgi:hypothetical protein